MQSIEHVSSNILTRQEQLIIWLRRKGLTMAGIGRQIGLKRAGAWRLLNADRAPVHRVEQLRQCGIPDELLPRAEDVPPGNKPGWKENLSAPA